MDADHLNALLDQLLESEKTIDTLYDALAGVGSYPLSQSSQDIITDLRSKFYYYRSAVANAIAALQRLQDLNYPSLPVDDIHWPEFQELIAAANNIASSLPLMVKPLIAVQGIITPSSPSEVED